MKFRTSIRRAIFILFLSSFITYHFPSVSFPVFGQSVTPNQATSSPQVRNRLQLLKNPQVAENHFQRLNKRISALINRFNKINIRIKSRINKLQADKNVIYELNSRLDLISGKIADLESSQKEIGDSWKVLLENKDSQDYQTLKNRLKEVINSAKALIQEEKLLLNELKKYKSN